MALIERRVVLDGIISEWQCNPGAREAVLRSPVFALESVTTVDGCFKLGDRDLLDLLFLYKSGGICCPVGISSAERRKCEDEQQRIFKRLRDTVKARLPEFYAKQQECFKRLRAAARARLDAEEAFRIGK